MLVKPKYGSIEAARYICEAWIEMEGTEWGESMDGLLTASKTSYGFSDEDCALFASKLMENLCIAGNDLMEFYEETEIKHAQKRAREAREYWLNGGNLGEWGTTKEDAKSTIELFPSWIFGE